MKRLAAMHDCPLLIVRAFTAVELRRPLPHDGMTMKEPLPPSSSTVFLICFPAMPATLRPAGSLPVRVAAATRGFSSSTDWNSLGIRLARSEMIVGKPRATKYCFNGQRALGHFRLNALAARTFPAISAGAAKTKNLPEGKVPGHHRQHRDPAADSGQNFLLALVATTSVGQVFLSGLSIVTANPGALLSLLHSGLERFCPSPSSSPARILVSPIPGSLAALIMKRERFCKGGVAISRNVCRSVGQFLL